MRKRIITLSLTTLFLGSFSLFSCSSGTDGENDSPDYPSAGSPGVVPENTDSGKNNNTEPDNVIPVNGESGNPGDNDNPDNTPTWNLVFEDNFEGSSPEPNPQYWSLAPRGDKTWNRYMSESYNQAYVKDGYLYLFGMEADGEYLTGGIESRGKFDFTYGQIKCRARFLRQPQGNHTGIWMMPEPPALEWPRSGEIDIMEHLDDQSRIFETAHFWNENEGTDGSKDAIVTVDNSEFNIYGIIWDKESISFTVNGEVYFTYSNDNPADTEFSYQYPFTKPFYLILSQSLGGRGTWEGEIDNGELPAIFQIDWIKVWQKSE